MKLCLALILFCSIAFSLPLDDYVNKPDASYKWEHVSTTAHEGWTLYVLKLTSQTWLDPSRIDRTVWEHWMRVIVPINLGNSGNALIYINGGGNPLGGPPTDATDYLPPVAMKLGDIVVELGQTPNQPIQFAGEDFGRSEDGFLAKTWDLFIQTHDPEVLGRFPMVKGVVRCMDALQEFAPTLPGGPVIRNFVLAGGSKRGWVVWLAGAVDTRVIAIAPLVIDVLNMNPNFNDIYRTYGRWPIALQDYTDQNVTRCLNCPIFDELAIHEDPLTYIDRFRERNVPIFPVNANGDEFFIPIGWSYWYQQYNGEKYLRYMPNAEHSMATAIERVSDSLTSFAYTIDNNIRRPQFTWELSADKTSFRIEADTTPLSVKLFEAYNRRTRAFIVNCYLTCFWRSTELPNLGNNTFVGTVEVPEVGYRAFMIEVEFDIGFEAANFVTSTGVSIVPDQFDHPPCPASVCGVCSTC